MIQFDIINDITNDIGKEDKMKKFRLIALMLVIATMSTVFAAWNFINYADSYESGTVSIKKGIVDTTVNSGEAISLSVDSTQSLTVSYAQKETGSTMAKATVNGGVTATVTENLSGAKDMYEYSFKVFADSAINNTKVNTEELTEATSVELDTDGKITISADQIADYLDYDFGKQPTENNLATFNSMLEAETYAGVYIKIYATKKP